MCQGGSSYSLPRFIGKMVGSDVNIMKNLAMSMVYNESFIMSATWNYVLEKEESFETHS